MFNKTRMPTKDSALAGRARNECRCPTTHFVNGARLQAPFPDGLERARVRAGLFLGSRAEVLGGARRLLDRGGIRRRTHAEPDLSRSLQRE